MQEQMGHARDEKDCFSVVSPSAPGEEAGKQSSRINRLIRMVTLMRILNLTGFVQNIGMNVVVNWHMLKP